MTHANENLHSAHAALVKNFREMTIISLQARSVLTFRTDEGRKLVFTVQGDHARMLKSGDEGCLYWTQQGAFHHFIRSDGVEITPLFAVVPEED